MCFQSLRSLAGSRAKSGRGVCLHEGGKRFDDDSPTFLGNSTTVTSQLVTRYWHESGIERPAKTVNWEIREIDPVGCAGLLCRLCRCARDWIPGNLVVVIIGIFRGPEYLVPDDLANRSRESWTGSRPTSPDGTPRPSAPRWSPATCTSFPWKTSNRDWSDIGRC